MTTHKLLAALGVAATTTLLIQSPVSAQSCQALPVVEGEGTAVEKTISPPSIGIFRNNWDVDFAASRMASNQYVADIAAEDGGEYSIEMYLKYPDGTADEVFNDVVSLDSGETFSIMGDRRISKRPYQVNLSVGGLSAIGNTYSASVLACA